MKKTMRVWQMIILCVALVGLLVTAFIPAIRINGSTMEAMTEEIQSMLGIDKLGALGELAEEVIDSEMEEFIKEFDDFILEYDKENGTSIYTISPIEIMTNDFYGLAFGDNAEEVKKNIEEGEKELEEAAAEMEDAHAEDKMGIVAAQSMMQIPAKYNIFRIALWCIYGLAFVSLVLVIIAFALKWSKVIPGLINAIYGLVVTGVFAVVRFVVLGSIAKSLGEDLINELLGMASDYFGSMDGISINLGPIFGCLYGPGFLIAMITGAVLLIGGVLTLLLGSGNTSTVIAGETNDTWIDNNNAWAGDGNNWNNSGDTPVFTPPVEETMPVTPVAPATPVAPVTPATTTMGTVRCTYGVAAGQGFSLPADKKVVIGKSAQGANLVINNATISNVHCSIRYNAMQNTYIVKDHSSNGTFVNGVRLPKGTPVEYPAGTILSLADGSNQVTLG